MNIRSAAFVKSAVNPSQYPSPDLPEIAFAGPSNVGKSSLINALLGRKKLVRTSATPGRTQTINFFVINESFYFADLPGYGYAKVPPAVQKRWKPMVETYCKTRQGLRAVVVILDVRRAPSQSDRDLLAWLDHCGIRQVIVMTKNDKLNRAKQLLQRRQIAEGLGMAPSDLIPFSSATGLGRQELWRALEGFL